MNLVLLEPGELDGEIARLTGRRARHLREVLRAAVDDTFGVGVVDGAIGEARVVSIDGDAVELSVRLTQPPPPPAGVSLLLAMPRPKVLRRVLSSCASLGVKRIVLVNAARVEAGYLDSPLLAPEAMREELLLGLEQARDTVVPEVTVERRFRPFVEDRLDATFPGTTRIVAHPVADAPVEDSVGASRETVLAVGPEGGWVPFELELMERVGFRRATLGPRALRVEVALPALVTAVQVAWRLGARG